MPLCTVCTHTKRREIDAALLDGAMEYRVVARRFGLVLHSVQRHADNHLGAQIRRSKEAHEMMDLEAIAARLREMEGKAEIRRACATARSCPAGPNARSACTHASIHMREQSRWANITDRKPP